MADRGRPRRGFAARDAGGDHDRPAVHRRMQALEIALRHGKDQPGGWSLRLRTREGAVLLERDDLPFRSPEFRRCTWFGLVGADTMAAAFFLDDVQVEKVQQFEADFIRYVQQNHPELKKEITSIAKIDDKVSSRLQEILTTFKQKMGYGAK